MPKILTASEEISRNVQFFTASEAFISIVDSMMKQLVKLEVDERNQIYFIDA